MKGNGMNIERLADALQEKLSSHPAYDSINYGGCGWFALELYTRLEELNVQAEIVHFGDYLAEGGSFDHVVLRVHDYLLDAEGIWEGEHGAWEDDEIGVLSPDLLAEVVQEPDRWNSTFPRKRIPELAPLIDEAVDEWCRL